MILDLAGISVLDLTEKGIGSIAERVVMEENSIDAVLNERGSRYGKFVNHAEITQRLKEVLKSYDGWGRLEDDQKETLEMVCHKMGRIINGDPNYADSWVDIAGYAKLISDRLEGRIR